MSEAAYDTWATANITEPDERDKLKALLLLVAPGSGEVYRLAKELAVAISLWNSSADGTAAVSAIVTALTAAEEIPNPTDLSGTGNIVRENLLNNIMSYVTTVQSLGTQAHLDNILPAAGSANVS